MNKVHTCHWPGCDRRVPPARWGCRRHWFALPLTLRNRIWATYVPGQEITKTPSAAYIVAAKDAQRWIAERELVADNKLSRGQQQPQLYRPSNATEGESFQSAWCDICARFDEGGCPILLATMAYKITEGEYPKEWHFDQFGQPQCSAYVMEGEPVPPPRCERTKDMFGDGR